MFTIIIKSGEKTDFTVSKYPHEIEYIGVSQSAKLFYLEGEKFMNAIYGRQSVDRADSISIESQIEHCMYEVKKEEYRIYRDKGYSGKNTERPDFQLMMEHIKQGLIKKVIVYKLDRISRSILDFSRMMETFQYYGVEFVSTTEKFDTSTPMGRAMLNICIVFAQLERETIQVRVTHAYISRSRAGFYMGGRIPYGFKREPVIISGINTSQYIPIEDEVKHMQIIYEKYSQSATSLSDVVKYLRENEIEKTRGAEWSTPRISEVLRNPIYVKADINVYNFYASRNTEIINQPDDFIGENGCYLYTKNKNNMGTKKNMSQYDNMVLVLAPHKGVIDSDIWIKCRLKADLNTQIPNRRKSYRTWISGKLKCGKCGYALRYNKWVGKTVKNEYYICTEVSGNRRCSGIGAVRKELIETGILKLIQEKIQEIKIEQNQPSQNQTVINLINISIINKEKEIDELINNFKSGSEAVMKRINIKVDEIENEMLNLKSELLQLKTNRSHKDGLDIDSINKIFESWDTVTVSKKQEIADSLIKKILVTSEEIKVEWKI